MSAEILNKTPTSGDYPEKHFGHTFNTQLWIKFMDNNFQEWVGCFSRSFQSFDKVLTNEANETAFIVAGGQGYMIDISTKELLFEINDGYTIESIIHTSNPELFLVSSNSGIYIFDNRKLLNYYEPHFMVDGIYFTEQKSQKVFGHLYSYQFHHDLNVGFEFDLETNEIIIDTNVKFRHLESYKYVKVNENEVKNNESFITKIIKQLSGK